VVKRRSLDDAMTPEEEAFLNTGKAAAEPVADSPPKPQQEEPPMARPTPLKESFIHEAAPPAKPPKAAQSGQTLAGTGAINARIDPTITTALLRASLDRRIERKVPSTQRDIIAEALIDWLKKHGYPM
jgi:hypothetical protein